jgi:PucR family transcriptional regulator, purine catabolism regulatory protein
MHTPASRGPSAAPRVAASLLPTVRQVLALPELRHGKPEVLAGASQLNQLVRWAHVSELPDITHSLRGRELLLTTGIALPASSSGLNRYVNDLADAGISALVIELGQRFREVPQHMLRVAERRGLPLVALRRGVQFVRVTEEVHSLIIDAESARVSASERAYRQLVELVVTEAPLERMLADVAQLLRRPVVLENLSHRVLAYGALDVAGEVLLRRWERRSRSLVSDDPIAVVANADDAWLVARIGSGDAAWGRLLVMLEGDVNQEAIAIVEATASVLAMQRLLDHKSGNLEARSHETLLAEVRRGTYSSTAELRVRLDSLGFPVHERRFISGLARVDYQTEGRQTHPPVGHPTVGEIVTDIARRHGVPALVAGLSADRAALILSLPGRDEYRDSLDSIARGVHQEFARVSPTPAVTVAVSEPVEGVRDLRRSLLESEMVAELAAHLDGGKLYYEMRDVSVEGFLFSLRDDPRMQAFIERELGPLLRLEGQRSTELLETLRTYLAAGQNKSEAAKLLGISRPTLYQRLEAISRLLDDSDALGPSSLSKHLALRALEFAGGGPTGKSGDPTS